MGRKRELLKNYDSDGNLISLECGKCHEVKVVSEFSKNKSKKDGVDTICKDCRKQYQSEYYKQNKDEITEYKSEYYKQNKDKLREYMTEYDKQNKDKIAEYKKEYYKQNKDKIAEYYKQNKDKKKEYQSEYYKQNKDKLREYMTEYNKQNKDKLREYYAEYYKQNIDKKKEYVAEWGKQNYKQKTEQALTEIKAYVEQDPKKYNYNPNKEIYGIIYLVHNVKSDKYYIGQTTNSFDIRYQSGWLYDHSYKDAVKSDLELYGEDSFEYVKIFKVAHTQRDLDRLEAYYIDYFNSYDNGYNETRGNIFTERK